MILNTIDPGNQLPSCHPVKSPCAFQGQSAATMVSAVEKFALPQVHWSSGTTRRGHQGGSSRNDAAPLRARDARRRVVITVQGPFEAADFLAVIGRWRGEDVGAYGMLYDPRGMTGEPSIADLRQFMNEVAQSSSSPRCGFTVLT